MKYTTTMLAALCAGTFQASAGSTPAPTGKAAPAPVCCPKPVADPCAGPISYTNAELLYAYSDWDELDDHGNGAILRAEYSPMDNFYLTGSAEYHDVSDINMWQITLGVGGYMPLCDNIHFAVDAGGVWASLEVDDFWTGGSGSSGSSGSFVAGYDEDDFGWYVRPHIRAKWGCFELHAGARYTDAGDLDMDEWSYFADLYYQVSPGWDLTVGASYNDDRTTVTGGARHRF
jgi:hypothetical protein